MSADNTSFISTSSGRFVFEQADLESRCRPLNGPRAKRNLLDFKHVLDQENIPFGLIFGTLLGVVRSGDLIAWDEDIDVFVLDEDREKLHDAMHKLGAAGLKLVRASKDLYSVMKDDEYIDIYVFRKVKDRRWCNDDVVAAEFLQFTETIDFMGERFYVPAKPIQFLEAIYGVDWRTPKQGVKGQAWSRWRRFKRSVKHYLPFLETARRRFC